jgi:hypothetical protein
MHSMDPRIIIDARSFYALRCEGTVGRVIALAVGWRLLSAEDQVPSRVSQCGICGGQNDSRTCCFWSPVVFTCRGHSTAAPYSLMNHLRDQQGPVRGRSSTETIIITRKLRARREFIN